MKALEAAYAERIYRWQDMAIAKIAEKLRTNNPDLIRTGPPLSQGSLMELRNDLVNLRTRITNFGRGQVNAEIKRQEA